MRWKRGEMQVPSQCRLRHRQGRAGELEERVVPTEKKRKKVKFIFKNCNFEWLLEELIEIEEWVFFFPKTNAPLEQLSYF